MSASAANIAEIRNCSRTDAVPAEATAVEQFIARVLHRVHCEAARTAPDEARAILHLAHSFADELATTNPAFDRRTFIGAAIAYPAPTRDTPGSA